MKQLQRITFDPQVMGGKPCIRGKRVTVGTIVGLIATGETIDLLDMNLPPVWVDFLENEGFQAIHWSNVGSHGASDKEIITWAKEQG
ncbi:MAG: DUF5615 family PIN-like protein [Deltaproteobacteria bacterium]|nr:DUF5615 family PIN-like protein [Deltaproteobacteria bacterium]